MLNSVCNSCMAVVLISHSDVITPFQMVRFMFGVENIYECTNQKEKLANEECSRDIKSRL